MNKKALATVLVLGVIISIGYFGTTHVLAGEINTTRHDTLITRLAEKFNLKESDVQAVFDSIKDERLADFKAKREEKLSQAVKDGVITEAQKTALIAKMDENISDHRKNKDDLKKWFDDNGIDHAKLRSYMGFPGKHHFGHKMVK